MIQNWRLDTQEQTLVLSAQNNRLPEIVYWSARLPDDENLETVALASKLDRTGGMLDDIIELSICPQASDSFPGHPGLLARDSNGDRLLPIFLFHSQHNQTTLDGNSLQLTYVDDLQQLRYSAHFRVYTEVNIIAVSATLESEHSIVVDWLSAPVIPASQAATEMIDFSGRWLGELQTNRIAWNPGIRARHNQTGRSGHEHFPSLLIPTPGSNYCHGEVYAMHYGWSGGHGMIAEELADGRRQVQFGHAQASENKSNTHTINSSFICNFFFDRY